MCILHRISEITNLQRTTNTEFNEYGKYFSEWNNKNVLHWLENNNDFNEKKTNVPEIEETTQMTLSALQELFKENNVQGNQLPKLSKDNKLLKNTYKMDDKQIEKFSKKVRNEEGWWLDHILV